MLSLTNSAVVQYSTGATGLEMTAPPMVVAEEEQEEEEEEDKA